MDTEQLFTSHRLDLVSEGFNQRNFRFTLKPTPEAEPTYRHIFSVLKPAHVLVVGGIDSGEALDTLILNARSANSPSKFFPLDTWLGTAEMHDSKLMPMKNGRPLLYEQFIANMYFKNYQNWVAPLCITEREAAKYLEGVMFDMVIINQFYDLHEMHEKMTRFWPNVKNGGIMIGNNWDPTDPEVKKTVGAFSSEQHTPFISRGTKWIVTTKSTPRGI
jgi:hypothetical protein